MYGGGRACSLPGFLDVEYCLYQVDCPRVSFRVSELAAINDEWLVLAHSCDCFVCGHLCPTPSRFKETLKVTADALQRDRSDPHHGG